MDRLESLSEMGLIHIKTHEYYYDYLIYIHLYIPKLRNEENAYALYL